jgi:hypothetical protein
MAIGFAGFFLSVTLICIATAASHCMSPAESPKFWADSSQDIDFIGFSSENPVDNILKFI